MNQGVKIAGVALNQTPIDWGHNTSNIIRAIQDAQKQHVTLLCLPELCVTGYGCEDLFLTQWVLNRAWKELKKICLYTQNMTVCVGLPIQLDSLVYNGVAILQDKKIKGITLKQNLPRQGVHYENRWFNAWPAEVVKEIHRGKEKIRVGDLIYTHQHLSFGIEICEDAWVRHRPADTFHRRGVTCILNPSASCFELKKSRVREALVLKSSLTYHCTYVYVNMLGNEAGKIIYDGHIIIAHQGRNVLKKNTRLSFKPYVLQSYDIVSNNTLRTHRRISSARKIDKNEEFTQALSLALFDYLRKSKTRGFALNLSGGIDSSCCAILVSEMVSRASKELGWEVFKKIIKINASRRKDAVREILTCVYQQTENSTSATLYAAKKIAQSIGSQFFTWSIDEEISLYRKKIEQSQKKTLTWSDNDLALQNIQARSRVPGIWLLANVKNFLLLVTSNRSEGDVGYMTMDGDTSGSLAPLAGIDKPFLIQWMRWAERNLNYKALHNVNRLYPSAELRPPIYQQRDEDDLGSYLLLLSIEKLAIGQGNSPQEVYDKLIAKSRDKKNLKKVVQFFFRHWAANQWKRERMAPSFHLDAFNIDPRSGYRFPILSGAFDDEINKL